MNFARVLYFNEYFRWYFSSYVGIEWLRVCSVWFPHGSVKSIYAVYGSLYFQTNVKTQVSSVLLGNRLQLHKRAYRAAGYLARLSWLLSNKKSHDLIKTDEVWLPSKFNSFHKKKIFVCTHQTISNECAALTSIILINSYYNYNYMNSYY